MNMDKTRQDHPELSPHTAAPIDAGSALTPHAAGKRGRRVRARIVHDNEEIRGLIAVNRTLERFDVAIAVRGQGCPYKMWAVLPDILITMNVTIGESGECPMAAQLRRYFASSRIKVLLINSAMKPGKERVGRTGMGACLTDKSGQPSDGWREPVPLVLKEVPLDFLLGVLER